MVDDVEAEVDGAVPVVEGLAPTADPGLLVDEGNPADEPAEVAE